LRRRGISPDGQLQFDFSLPPAVKLVPIVHDLEWREVTDIAKGAGISSTCLVSTALYDQLDDQSLHDALWTAGYTLFLNDSPVVQFTLELDKKCTQFKAIQINRAVHLGRAIDF
jgi:hypothetical protein